MYIKHLSCKWSVNNPPGAAYDVITTVTAASRDGSVISVFRRESRKVRIGPKVVRFTRNETVPGFFQICCTFGTNLTILGPNMTILGPNLTSLRECNQNSINKVYKSFIRGLDLRSRVCMVFNQSWH